MAAGHDTSGEQKRTNALPGTCKPPIRSYVRREGRLTTGQARALSEQWPRYGIRDDEQLVRPAELFGRDAPCVFEIGFGNGESLLEQALAHPENDYLGAEVYRPGIGRLLHRAAEQSLSNLRVFQGDAVDILRDRLAPACLQRIHVFFPDPWPKKRHHKRRIVRPEFARLAARVLKPNGELWLATDWDNYAEHMLEVMESAPEFVNLAVGGHFVEPAQGRPATRFEQRGLKRGHAIHDLRYRRVAE